MQSNTLTFTSTVKKKKKQSSKKEKMPIQFRKTSFHWSEIRVPGGVTTSTFESEKIRRWCQGRWVDLNTFFRRSHLLNKQANFDSLAQTHVVCKLTAPFVLPIIQEPIDCVLLVSEWLIMGFICKKKWVSYSEKRIFLIRTCLFQFQISSSFRLVALFRLLELSLFFFSSTFSLLKEYLVNQKDTCLQKELTFLTKRKNSNLTCLSRLKKNLSLSKNASCWAAWGVHSIYIWWQINQTQNFLKKYPKSNSFRCGGGVCWEKSHSDWIAGFH